VPATVAKIYDVYEYESFWKLKLQGHELYICTRAHESYDNFTLRFAQLLLQNI